MLDNEQIDLLIIDRNLPSGDSLEKIQDLESKDIKKQLFFLQPRLYIKIYSKALKVVVMIMFVKPFDFNELLLRIKAILKRHKKEEEKLSFGDFILDLVSYEFFYKNQKLEISNLDYELLKCFFENPNTLLTRQFLSESVWKDDTTSDKTINIALTRLRNKFPKLKDHIISVRGIGYKLC